MFPTIAMLCEPTCQGKSKEELNISLKIQKMTLTFMRISEPLSMRMQELRLPKKQNLAFLPMT